MLYQREADEGMVAFSEPGSERSPSSSLLSCMTKSWKGMRLQKIMRDRIYMQINSICLLLLFATRSRGERKLECFCTLIDAGSMDWADRDTEWQQNSLPIACFSASKLPPCIMMAGKGNGVYQNARFEPLAFHWKRLTLQTQREVFHHHHHQDP